GQTEDNGPPLTLLEKHNPWPAYVTCTSPAVRRLIEKSRVRELECMCAAEENHKPMRLSKPSFIQQKRRKSSKFSELMLKDALSETRLTPWEPYSAPNALDKPGHILLYIPRSLVCDLARNWYSRFYKDTVSSQHLSREPLSTIQKHAIQQLGVEPQQSGATQNNSLKVFMSNECRT
ncbi:hypothetical protein A6R68_19825, partial [Neotoma lepida]